MAVYSQISPRLLLIAVATEPEQQHFKPNRPQKFYKADAPLTTIASPQPHQLASVEDRDSQDREGDKEAK